MLMLNDSFVHVSDHFRLELSLRGCVLGPLLEADIGCTLDDVNKMFQLPAVREGLLDSVRPRCGELTPYAIMDSSL